MTDNDMIGDIIGVRLTTGGSMDGDSDYEHQSGIGNDDDVADLKNIIMSMQVTIDTLDKRIAALELDNERMKMNESYERPITRATMPQPFAMKHTTSPAFRRRNSRDAETESFSNVSRARSEMSATPSASQTPSAVMRNPAVFSMSSPMVFKNNSAISSRGYDNKLSLWATVFTSLMVACMKRYIQKRGEVGHIIDETVLMKTYTKIMADLYSRVKSSELPAVQSHEATLLSKMFHRKKKDEVPESNPNSWLSLRESTDGVSCLSVIEGILTAAKMVPEAMIHPISRLVTAMDQPFLVKTPTGPTFAIPSDTKIEMTPTGIERFCSWLKKDSLKTYVRYRLDGDTEMAAINRMMASSQMKDTDLFDAKHLYKGRELLRQMSTE